MEREHFYNNEVAYLLRDAPANIIVGGDFNCVLQTADTTGHCTYSSVLAGLVQGFDLRDVWRQHPEGRVYTQYSPTGAIRIDPFYATKNMLGRKIAAKTVAAVFTDHHAVMLRL
jgi:hypothetical protein